MRPFIVGGMLLVTASATRVAAADEVPPVPAKAIELAVRAGPAFVVGNAEDGVKMLSQLGIPLILAGDFGYRLGERLYLGGFFTTGFGLVKPSPCLAGYSCTGPAIVSDIGGVGRYYLARKGGGGAGLRSG